MTAILDTLAVIAIVGGVTLFLCGTMGLLRAIGSLILEARRLR